MNDNRLSSKRLAFEIILLCCCVYIPLSVVLDVEVVVIESVVVVV